MGFGIGSLGDAWDAATDFVSDGAEAFGDALDAAGDAAKSFADSVGDVSLSDIGHTTLDVAGMVPVIGEAADLANAGWYLAEGDKTNAALSLAGAIPLAGNAATAAKWGKKGLDAVDMVTDGAKALDRAGDAAKGADNVMDGARATPSRAIDELPSGDKPDFTFRGDARGPDEIFGTGFEPRGTNTDLYDYAANNTPSIYVSTSKSSDVATDFATGFGSRDGYVYAVNPRNGIDVNDALGPRSPFPDELEVAVPGGVKPSDVRGATPVSADGTPGSYSVLNPNFGGQ